MVIEGSAAGPTRPGRILVAHEWLERIGGSENALAQILASFPDARLACLWNNAPDRFPRAEETWLARTPMRRSKVGTLPLMHATWQRVPLTNVETVVASSHAMAHHLAGRAAREGLHAFAYVYSPPRYLWAADLDERGRSALARLGGGPMRRVDRLGVDPRVRYIAISAFVAERMRRTWGVDAEIVHPPVDTARLLSNTDWSEHLTEQEQSALAGLSSDFVLGASRLVAYKRLDVAMRVGEILDLPVVIAGDGPIEADLRRQAQSLSVPVHFLGRVSDSLLYTLYQRTRLFVFMPIEDFGIMPVEAMALGAPTLLRNTGGTREIAGMVGAGVCADPDDPVGLAARARIAVDAPVPMPSTVSGTFSHERFRSEFRRVISN